MDHAPALVAFADAVVSGDEGALARARAQLLAGPGPEGLVDAAAVAANFERMVRIADSTGIPLDAPVSAMTADLRAEIGVDRFASAANTPAPGWLTRVLGRALRPWMPRLLRLGSLLAARSRAREG